MNKPTPPTTHGKPGLLDFARRFHPRHEHTIADLETLLRRIGFEMTDFNEDRIIVAGPLRTTTACRTLLLYGGRPVIRHLELIKSLARLLEVGLPVWKTEGEQLEWHCLQLEQCAPFEVRVVDEFETRAAMEAHLANCAVCQPAVQLLASALSFGSSRHSDAHLRELIDKSHADQAEAVKFYAAVVDAQRPPFLTLEKPPRARRKEVNA